MSGVPQFHLALGVRDLNEARVFYGELLGCTEGRSSATWIDFNFYGHQLVAHLASRPAGVAAEGHVDGVAVPIPHFGVALAVDAFEALACRLTDGGVPFIIAPSLRYTGKPAEQRTMFFLDPSGNALEIKAFTKPEMIFAR